MNNSLLDKGLDLYSVWPIPESLEFSCKKYPKISVVSPNYNYARTLERTIKSIVDQKYSNLEYIINKCEESLIDNGDVFLMSEKNENINGWVIDNNIKLTHKLNFELLNNCNFYRKIK